MFLSQGWKRVYIQSSKMLHNQDLKVFHNQVSKMFHAQDLKMFHNQGSKNFTMEVKKSSTILIQKVFAIKSQRVSTIKVLKNWKRYKKTFWIKKPAHFYDIFMAEIFWGNSLKHSLLRLLPYINVCVSNLSFKELTQSFRSLL